MKRILLLLSISFLSLGSLYAMDTGEINVSKHMTNVCHKLFQAAAKENKSLNEQSEIVADSLLTIFDCQQEEVLVCMQNVAKELAEKQNNIQE